MKAILRFRQNLVACRAVTISLLLLVFISDIYTLLGFAHGILYIPVLVLAMQCFETSKVFERSVLLIALLSILAGYYLAPSHAEFPLGYVVANRILSAIVLLVTYFSINRSRMFEAKYSEREKEEHYREAFLEHFIEAMPNQVWSANTQGQVDFVGQQLSVFTGKSQEEILSDWLAVVHPDDRERTMAVWLHCVESGQPYQVNFRIRRHDGVYVWFETRAIAQKDENGQVKYWLGSSTDIDDLLRLREESSRLAEQFRHTVESITDAFFTLDKAFRITYLNQNAADTLGGNVEELLGKIIWDTCPMGYDSPFAVKFRKASHDFDKLHFEDYYEPAMQWLEVHVYPSADGITVFFSDVTSRRKEQEQLLLLNTAVSRLNDIVMITEAEPISEPGPRTVFVNDAFEKRTGFSREEAIGSSPRMLQGPKTSRKELDRIRTALEKWQPVRAQLINYKKSGEEFWLELDIVPLANEEGWYTHFVSVERDITEQKKLQEQLAASQKMESIGQLTGGIAHDFNNLLMVILGNAEILQEEVQGNKNHEALAALIGQAAEKGAALTKNLLAFARRQPLSPSVVHVVPLLKSLTPILKTSLSERNKLEVDLPEKLWPIYIDPSQLESALLNLAINARDAMPTGGTVKISARHFVIEDIELAEHKELAQGRYVQITFSDNGIGMSPDVQQRIFEPFYSTKSETGGNGLGLSMIYGFLKQSKGAITLYSEPGLGATFHLYLPCTNVPDEPDLTPNATLPVTLAQNVTVLIVEDNPEIRSLASNVLSTNGFTVLAASSGDEGLCLIEDGAEPDLLFTDIVMPGKLSGMDLAEIVTARLPKTKVILTSGFADLGSVQQIDALQHVMLPKPYRKGDLLKLIFETLNLNG